MALPRCFQCPVQHLMRSWKRNASLPPAVQSYADARGYGIASHPCVPNPFRRVDTTQSAQGMQILF
jgi:hypothetical protein